MNFLRSTNVCFHINYTNQIIISLTICAFKTPNIDGAYLPMKGWEICSNFRGGVVNSQCQFCTCPGQDKCPRPPACHPQAAIESCASGRIYFYAPFSPHFRRAVYLCVLPAECAHIIVYAKLGAGRFNSAAESIHASDIVCVFDLRRARMAFGPGRCFAIPRTYRPNSTTATMAGRWKLCVLHAAKCNQIPLCTSAMKMPQTSEP